MQRRASNSRRPGLAIVNVARSVRIVNAAAGINISALTHYAHPHTCHAQRTYRVRARVRVIVTCIVHTYVLHTLYTFDRMICNLHSLSRVANVFHSHRNNHVITSTTSSYLAFPRRHRHFPKRRNSAYLLAIDLAVRGHTWKRLRFE